MKLDPSIRLAIEGLADRIPSVASSMRRRAPFVGNDGDVLVRGRWDNGGFRTRPTPQPDGSIVKDHAAAEQEIRRQLAKRGAGEAEVATAVETWRDAPLGELVSLGRGISIRNGAVESFAPDLANSVLAADECALAIAYRFLALAIGPGIYAASLNGVRLALRNVGRRDDWSAEPGILRGPYEPLHGIGLMSIEPCVCVRMCLFGQIVWDIRFNRVRLSSMPHASAYEIRLDDEVTETVA